MSLVEALILAVLQALTEFLPVSSSGHLVVAGALLSDLGADDKEAFYVLLHTASVVAVLVWFGKDVVRLLRRSDRWRSVATVVVGCVPAGIAGLAYKLFGGEGLFDAPIVAAFGWLASAAFLWFARSPATGTWSLFDSTGPVRWGAILAIGFAQAVAIVPGVSRSGSTIGMALLVGMISKDAFRYSFLMALPLILGAQLLELDALSGLSATAGTGVLAAGAITCFVVSLVALGLLQHTVKLSRMHWFAPYCLLAALVTFALIAAGVVPSTS